MKHLLQDFGYKAHLLPLPLPFDNAPIAIYEYLNVKTENDGGHQQLV